MGSVERKSLRFGETIGTACPLVRLINSSWVAIMCIGFLYLSDKALMAWLEGGYEK
jgi:hypothetical protein